MTIGDMVRTQVVGGGWTVIATQKWLTTSGAEFSAGQGSTGWAHLRHYSARYCTWGEGPPLVLIPGMAGGFELLGPLARMLSTQFRVISYQLRGEDDCFALRNRFDLPDLVEDLREFLDWFGLEAPPILGVSFGGVLGLELAVRYPRRLNSLIVQGTGVRLEKGLVQQVAALILARYPLPSDSPFVNQFFNLLFGSRQKPGPLFDFVTSRCWHTDQSVMAHRFALIRDFDIEARANRVRVPTLVMAGKRDILVSETSRNALARRIPEAELVELGDCGHLAFVTHPELVSQEVLRFTL
jgi:pimeloyl-ACP methyl ester carboxylesterase